MYKQMLKGYSQKSISSIMEWTIECIPLSNPTTHMLKIVDTGSLPDFNELAVRLTTKWTPTHPQNPNPQTSPRHTQNQNNTKQKLFALFDEWNQKNTGTRCFCQAVHYCNGKLQNTVMWLRQDFGLNWYNNVFLVECIHNESVLAQSGMVEAKI